MEADDLRFLPGTVAADPVAVRRGVTVVRFEFDDWKTVGEPTSIALYCDAGRYSVPVMNNGRKRGWITWRYRRACDGPPPSASKDE
jgi:hypothetical protein